jgi:hypothetical protein
VLDRLEVRSPALSLMTLVTVAVWAPRLQTVPLTVTVKSVPPGFTAVVQAAVTMMSTLVGTVVLVVVVVVVVSHGSGKQTPVPASIPPSAKHSEALTSMQVSKAPIGDDCVQH